MEIRLDDVTRITELENLKIRRRWVSDSKLQYEQQLKSHDILPVCYQIEILTFTMISKTFSGRYLYDPP